MDTRKGDSSAFYKARSGALIKILYGGGWLGFKSQKQTLNSQGYKKQRSAWDHWAKRECKEEFRRLLA